MAWNLGPVASYGPTDLVHVLSEVQSAPYKKMRCEAVGRYVVAAAWKMRDPFSIGFAENGWISFLCSPLFVKIKLTELEPFSMH